MARAHGLRSSKHDTVPAIRSDRSCSKRVAICNPFTDGIDKSALKGSPYAAVSDLTTETFTR